MWALSQARKILQLHLWVRMLRVVLVVHVDIPVWANISSSSIQCNREPARATPIIYTPDFVLWSSYHSTYISIQNRWRLPQNYPRCPRGLPSWNHHVLPLASINICFQVDIPKDASLLRLSGPNHNVPSGEYIMILVYRQANNICEFSVKNSVLKSSRVLSNFLNTFSFLSF